MTLIWRAIAQLVDWAAVLQILFYLPLALDLAGTEAFLALGASLASYAFLLATLRLASRRSTLASVLASVMSGAQMVAIPAALLVCFNVYSPPLESYFAGVAKRTATDPARAAGAAVKSVFFVSQPAAAAAASAKFAAAHPRVPVFITAAVGYIQTLDYSEVGDMAWRMVGRATLYLAHHVPSWWSTLLRSSSPLFSLLEGVASVLVIQALGSISRWVIAVSNARPSAPATSSRRFVHWVPSLGLGKSEGWQLFFLLVSAFIYVTSAGALYSSFEGATRKRPQAAAAVGASVSSTLWLTAIAFGVRKGNVVETSLFLAYVVFNVTQLSDSLAFTADPLALIRGFKRTTSAAAAADVGSGGLPYPISSSFWALLELLVRLAEQSVDFVAAASAALPKSVLASLVYRLMVLYLASRILPMLKRGGPPRWLNDSFPPTPGESPNRSPQGLRPSLRPGAYDVPDDDEDTYTVYDDDTLTPHPEDPAITEWALDQPLDDLTSDGTPISTVPSSVTASPAPTTASAQLPVPSTVVPPSVSRRSSSRSTATTKQKLSRLPVPEPVPGSVEPDGTTKDKKDLRVPGDAFVRPASDLDDQFGFFDSILCYSRFILIAVYSHLLLLDQSHQIYWRFLTVAITLALWTAELCFATEGADAFTRDWSL